MAKKKSSTREVERRLAAVNSYKKADIEITDEPIRDRAYRKLPQQVRDASERLYAEAQISPKKAIPELRELVEKYPDVPLFSNYLAEAYIANREIDEAETVVLENIQKHPDYLFARLNYVELCLRRKEYEKIPEILDHKFNLPLLYPERKRFHISEVVSFMGLVGLYFFATHQRAKAEEYNQILQRIGPEYPVAKILKRKLAGSWLARLQRRLFGGKSLE